MRVAKRQAKRTRSPARAGGTPAMRAISEPPSTSGAGRARRARGRGERRPGDRSASARRRGGRRRGRSREPRRAGRRRPSRRGARRGPAQRAAGARRWARRTTGLAVPVEALCGGLPGGRVTELAGAPSTGRTGLACAIAATATRAGETIAWVDPADALEPEAAAAAGIALARLLWARPRGVSDAFRAAEILLGAGGFGLVVLDVDAPRAGAGVWPRLARAAERTGSALLVVAPRREAGTFAALGLELDARRVRWSGGPGRLVLLEGIDARRPV